MCRRIQKLRRKLASLFSKSKKRRGGFTLVEVIMTVILIAVLGIPLSMFVFQNVSSTFQSQDYSMAANLARFEMERVSNSNYDTLATAFFSNYQGYNYDLLRTVSFVLGNAGSQESIKLIRVDVAPTGTTNVISSFVTYRGRNITYGL